MFSISFHYICIFCIFRKKNSNDTNNSNSEKKNQPSKCLENILTTKIYNAASASTTAVLIDYTENTTPKQNNQEKENCNDTYSAKYRQLRKSPEDECVYNETATNNGSFIIDTPTNNGSFIINTPTIDTEVLQKLT